MRRLFLVVLLSLSLFGCAAIRAAEARYVTLDRELSVYVIKKPMPEVWKVALDEDVWMKIFDAGYGWDETGRWTASSNVKSETEKIKGGFELTKRWFEAEGNPVGDGGQVRFFEVSERTTIRDGQEGMTDRSRTRRFDMEIDLIKHFDPAGGAGIEQKAEVAAKAAAEE